MMYIYIMDTIRIVYEFLFPDKTVTAYEVLIDKETLRLIPAANKTSPDWAKLENKKCGHCPLKKEDYPYCPIADNLSHIVEAFKSRVSFSEVMVKVTTAERAYVKKLSLQDGMHGLFGLIMATSACPHMDFLKPMARYHLPFSTSEETIVRSVSMYLLRQYFVAKKGGNPDLNLSQLEQHYNDITAVNMGILSRIRGIAQGDADVNAITVLQSFGSLLTMAISKDLSKIEPLFTGLK